MNVSPTRLGTAASNREEPWNSLNWFAKKTLTEENSRLSYLFTFFFLEKTPTNAEVSTITSEPEPVTSDSALMRLAPIPLFFYRSPKEAVHY